MENEILSAALCVSRLVIADETSASAHADAADLFLKRLGFNNFQFKRFDCINFRRMIRQKFYLFQA